MDKLITKLYVLLSSGMTLFMKEIGGFRVELKMLVVLMAFDYFTGLVSAGIFKKSNKTTSGGLSSKAGFTGIFRKLIVIMLIYVISCVEKSLGTDFLTTCVIFAYAYNELISITENLQACGIFVPEVIQKLINIVKNKGDK